jgi:hypothetical protein
VRYVEQADKKWFSKLAVERGWLIHHRKKATRYETLQLWLKQNCNMSSFLTVLLERVQNREYGREKFLRSATRRKFDRNLALPVNEFRTFLIKINFLIFSYVRCRLECLS